STMTVVRFIVAGLTCLSTMSAWSQPTYPAKQIRLIVGFAPGGGSDILSRALAQRLTLAVGQPVIIDNRPGAGGAIGAEIGARAVADGYTLTVGSSGAFAVNPNLHAKLAYDPLKDFVPVGMFGTFPYVLIVHPSVTVKSVRELIALARRTRGQLNYGSAGNGSGNHLVMEHFLAMSGARMTHVPYKGGILALTAVMTGELETTFDPIVTATAQLKAGRVRGLAVSSAKRASLLPDMPTVSEAGVPGFEAANWFGVFAPSGTPRAVIDQLNAAINKSVQTSEMRDTLHAQGADALMGTPDDLAELLKRELDKYRIIIKNAQASLK
ncbi:MAG TPA: tripartite tricarboxylate transporter substrate binding protein, partial [Burkholderiales bacterium]|nr:tripartite tricarboxylate transporter substrate binding protein [Burkholderiales bacterium]